jgi:hypothetical protein
MRDRRPKTAKTINELLANNGMRRVLYPPYFPDFALCDFFLFNYVKNKLMRWSFSNAD